MVTCRISAEIWIRPGDRRCRRNKLRQLAEFVGDSNWIIVHQTVVCYSSVLYTNNCKLMSNCQLTLELLRIWEIISYPYTLTLNNVQTVDWYNNKPSTVENKFVFTILASQPNISRISAENCVAEYQPKNIRRGQYQPKKWKSRRKRKQNSTDGSMSVSQTSNNCARWRCEEKLIFDSERATPIIY